MRIQIVVSVLLLGLLGLALGQVATASQEATTPTPPTPIATPTIDRLAAPPTVASPTQADEGAQLYWLHCQPCHGDQGQGLTDDWRAQYPPEDQNCWESGCHGKRPYENGFQLPESVPALIGPGSLGRFTTMGQVHEFMRTSMPFQNPGHLAAEEYLAITAYLARAHDVWDGRRLTADSAAAVQLKAPLAEAQPQAELQPEPSGYAAPSAGHPSGENRATWAIAGIGILGIILLILGGVSVWRKLKR